MPLSPQRRRRTTHAGNPSLANDCQKLATVNPSAIPHPTPTHPEQP